MTQPNGSIDGFVPRRPTQGADPHQRRSISAAPQQHIRPQVGVAPQQQARPQQYAQYSAPSPQPVAQPSLRSSIEQGLRDIDTAPAPTPTPKRAPKKHKKTHLLKKIIVRLMIVLILVGIGLGGFVAYKAFTASGSVFKGNIWGLTQKVPLQTDANGRSNILIFGTSEDDEGGDHPGAYLTDSLLLVSVHQEKKDAYMVSIPRDLWVKYDTTCVAGLEGKINALFDCYSEAGKKQEYGAQKLREKISEVTGMSVQYSAHVNYSVVRDAVDAVGGVEVAVQGTGELGHLGILDRNFDWKCNYQCHYVKYKNGPTGIMDGEHALALARARGASTPTYGLANANYDREVNQQKILKALQQKAISAGTLTDIGKVTKLLDAFGTNLRTNFEQSEVQTLMELGKTLSPDSIQSLSLVDEEEPVTVTGDIAGQSIVQATSGLYDYSSVRNYLRRSINASPLTRENSTIAVYNGTTVSGLAGQVAEQLEEASFTVGAVGNAPKDAYQAQYVIHQITEDDKPATRAALLEQLNGAVFAQELPGFVVDARADFVVIIGKDTTQNTQ